MSEIDKTLLDLDLLPNNVPIGSSDIFYAVINGHDYAVPFARIANAALTEHGLVSDKHTVSGLTTGHFLRATSATAFEFGALTKQDVTSVLSDWFELVGDAPNQYIRCKYPFAGDYEIQAWSNTGWLPPNVWEAMPIASADVLGGVKIGANITRAADGTISVASGAAMTYPAAGIPVSTGSSWAASITNNSENWNTAYSWGNHAGLYAPIGTVSSQWVTSGSDIYYNRGNVGIGAAPSYKLHLAATPPANGGVIYVRDPVTLGTDSFVAIGFASSPGYDWYIGKATTSAGAGLFQVRDHGHNVRMSISENGNVGIGRTPTTYKCEVAGDLFAIGGWLRNDGARGWYNETYGGGIYMEDSTYVRVYNSKKFLVNNDIITQGGYFSIFSSGGVLKWTIRLNTSTDEIDFYNASGVKKAWIDQDGNLKAKGELTAYAT